MGQSISVKVGIWTMARRRNTGSRPIESRRARIWRKVKNGYQKVRAFDWSNWIKALAAVGSVVLTFWTNSIREKGNTTAKELSDLKAAVVMKEAEYKTQIQTVNNKVDDCKRQWQQQINEIREEAKRLPPSPQKRRILTLTKQEPLKTGALIGPLRATEAMPPIPERGN